MTHAERCERRRQIAETVRGGASLKEACKKHGVTATLVYASCAEHDVDLKLRASPRVLKVIAALQDPGRSLAEIARSFGISPQRVSQIYEEAVTCGIRLTGR